MDGQAKGGGMGDAVQWTEGESRNDARQLEADLRLRLRDVDLICEADPPVEALQAAEEVCRRHFTTTPAVTRLAERSPATLATYIALRGAERYEGIALWPQLGVTQIPSWHVGQGFLSALRRMGLRDFQEMVRHERARTYVAPILIHGGIPAEHARRLVERLEVELRRGLPDGPEAVRRLTAFPEGLGRPTQRLLRYAPEFSGALLDALIDRITGDASATGRGIPRHLHDALEAGDQATRRGLRRLSVPYVELDDWAGYGPTIVAPDNASSWAVEHADHSFLLNPGESAEIDPCWRLSVQSGGQRRLLWNRPVVWFTDAGRLLGPDAALPGVATALFPRGWEIHDSSGLPLRVVREGAGLSGAWSRHHAVSFDLDGVDRVHATPPADAGTTRALTWPVSAEHHIALVGDQVVGVATSDGAPVFAAPPRIDVSQGDDVTLWFRSAGGPPVHRVVRPDDAPASGIGLAEWLGTGVLHGRLHTRLAGGTRHDWQLTVVPGLAVAGLDRPFGPDSSGTATVRARSSGGEVATTVEVPPLVDEVRSAISVDGVSLDLAIDVPRVRWGLRSRAPRRLDLAPGVISAEFDELSAEDVWLLVRCGRPAKVALELYVDGRPAQVSRDNETRATGGRHHQCAFPLAPYGDTLRRHRDAAIELVCRVDGEPLLAVVSGDAPVRATRSWDSRQRVEPAPARDPWRGVGGLSEPGARSALRDLASDEARALAERILVKIRTAPPADQVVTYLRLLGDSSRRWRAAPVDARAARDLAEWGPGGRTWAAYEAVADELWGLQGLRYRRFAGKPLDDAVLTWVRDTRAELRSLDRTTRSLVEQWSFGRLPPFERIQQWAFTDWLAACLAPSRPGASGVDLLPAALLYHVLSVAGDEPESGGPVAAAVDVAPTMVVELIALALEAARRGHHLVGPVLRPPEESGETDEPGSAPTATEEPPRRARLRKLDGCQVAVTGNVVRLTPSEPVEPFVLRLWSDGPRPHAVAAMFPTIEGTDHVSTIPTGLSGRHLLCVADPRSSALHCTDGLSVDLGAPPPRASATVEVRGNGLADLEALRRRTLVARVARAVGSDDLGDAPVEKLFDDENTATTALLEFATTNVPTGQLDRLGITILPTTMLFSHLPVSSSAANDLRRSSRVLWAALGPRVPSHWRGIGWPNGSKFATGGAAYDDIVVFARTQSSSSRDRPVQQPTFRYEMPREAVPGDRVRETIRRLDRHEVERTFVDLVVATYCAINVEAVSTEATRLLLRTHDRLPDTTVRAVLVGTALHLASTGTK